jgi:hypothetical protein
MADQHPAHAEPDPPFYISGEVIAATGGKPLH